MTEVVRLAREVHGPTDPTAHPGEVPTIVLVHGLGVMGAWWPPGIVDGLAESHRVVVPDLRDSGRSPRMGHRGDPAAAFAAWSEGATPAPPYPLEEVAADVVGLLDELGTDRAHLVGASMGAMVAQHVAFGWPDRVASLTSMMSTTGAPSLPTGDPDVLASLVEEVPRDDEETFVRAAMESARRLTRSPLFDAADAERRYRAYWAADPDPDPAAGSRHLVAVLADGDRTDRLGLVATPTLVVHGTADPMIPVEAGRATAAAVPGATLLELADTGHELPGAVHDQVVGAIRALVARAGDVTTP